MTIYIMRILNKAAIVAVIIAGMASASCSKDGASATAAEGAGPVAKQGAGRAEVVFVEGDASIDGVAAEPGARLSSRFTARTGPGSKLEIVFDDRNVLSVGQNAFVDIDLTDAVPKLRLERGGVTAVLKKLSKLADGDSFSLITGQSVMGVRGTSFCAWALDGSTYICACNGEVHTADAAGAHGETLSAAHHLGRVFTSSGGAYEVEPAGMQYHTDESVQAVASRIGYTIDWARVDR